jgi:Ca-activated chloride channel family protein
MPTAAEYARTFVAVTDGYVSVEPQVFRTIRENLDKANFFAFGIGSSVNRHLIEGMARMGMGEPFIVMHGDDAAEKANKFKVYIDSPALTDIAVSFDGFDAYDVEPAAPPDLFASRPVLVFGKYKGKAKGKIRVTGTSGAGRFQQVLEVGKYEPSAKNEALRYLWARHRIGTLSDYQTYERGDDKVAEITQLGLDYHLMTQYTSFVAVDQRVRNEGGEQTTVKQPLPLPDGVSDRAVGGSVAGERSRGRPTAAPMKVKTSKLARNQGFAADEEVAAAEAPAADPAPKLEPPAPPQARKVSIASFKVVSGPRASADLGAALRRLEPKLAGCLQGASATTGQQVTIELTIAKDGTVKASRVIKQGVAQEVGRCFLRSFNIARLAALPEGQSGDTVVQVTLTLSG